MKATIPILAKGAFPHTVKGKKVTQVVDEEALRAIEQQEIPPEGLLLDFDHYSDLTADEIAKLKEMGIKLPSEAAGWIHGITRVGERLFAAVDLTSAGEAAIAGKNYVFTSPVFDRNGLVPLETPCLRPTLIKKVALTNEPNIKAIGSLRNRAGEDGEDGIGGEILFPIANRGDGAEPETQNPNKEKTMLIKQLATLLGCEETEEATLAAAKKLVASLEEITSASKAAKEAKEKAETAQAEAEAKSSKAWAEADAARAEAKAAIAAKDAAEAKAAEDLANRAAEAEKSEAEKAELKSAKEAAESQLGDLKNRVAELEGQIAEKDKSIFDAKVAAELDKHPDLANRAEAEAVLRADFEAGCRFLATLPAPAKAPTPRPFGATPEDLANRAGDGEETSGEATGCDRIVKALKNK